MVDKVVHDHTEGDLVLNHETEGDEGGLLWEHLNELINELDEVVLKLIGNFNRCSHFIYICLSFIHFFGYDSFPITLYLSLAHMNFVISTSISSPFEITLPSTENVELSLLKIPLKDVLFTRICMKFI